MTETSPMASVARVPPSVEDPRRAFRLRAMRAASLPLVEYRVDEDAGGELQVRGPTIAGAYYEDETGAEKFTDDGWLKTGDVAEVEDGAFIKLVDRTKDLVKSGGEWISSVELENAIMGHPEVARGRGRRRGGRSLGRAAVRLHRATRRERARRRRSA